MESRYGLLDRRIRESFYAMAPGATEGDSEFVLRVEDEHIRLRESQFMCYKEFVPRLSAGYRRGLDQLRIV